MTYAAPVIITNEDQVPAVTAQCPYQVKITNGYKCVQSQEEYEILSSKYNHDLVFGLVVVFVIFGALLWSLIRWANGQ